MNYRPPGTLTVLKLLAWTSLTRLLRAARIRRGQRARKGGPRVATERKGGDGLMLLLVVALPALGLQSLTMTTQAVQHLGVAMQHTAADADTMLVDAPILAVLAHAGAANDDVALLAELAGASAGEHGNPPPARVLEQFRRRGQAGFGPAPLPSPAFDLLMVRAVEWPNQAAADAFASAGALLLLTLLAMLLTISVGGANTTLGGGEWTQAWLLTFPVSTRSLVLARALDYSLVQFFPWLTMCPLLLQLLRAQAVPGSLAIAIVATLLTALLTGSLRLWMETWLRLRFSLRTLRSIQGVCTLLALLLMALLFGSCLGSTVPQWFLDLARSAPGWLQRLPAAWPMALADVGPAAALLGALPMLVVFAVACVGTVRLLAHGAMRSGGVDPGERAESRAVSNRARGLGVIGKDLTLLRRDRNFLVQTLVVPVFVIGLQLIVNPGLGAAHGRGLAMLAYGIGVYSLVGGCFQVLSSEGRALWILYTLPVGIGTVLLRKTRLWASIAVGFGLCALLGFSVRAGDLDLLRLLCDGLFVSAGVFCAAHIAAGMSILGSDPAADYVPRQPKQRHVYLYMFFAGTYVLGLQSPDLGVRVAGLLVFATLAFSLWQRAGDRLRWLLDPVSENRSSIGAYDGGAAVLVFFALQALTLGIVMAASPAADGPSATQLLVAVAIAGAASVALFLLLLSSRGVPLAEVLGFRVAPAWLRRSVVAGAAVGILIGGLGLAYVYVARSTGWIDFGPPLTRDRTALLLLAVVAAPLIEEVLFRGLLFQGLLRSVPLRVAVPWSAGVFAAVHPMHSWLPVFLLGCGTAIVFHRTRCLPAAMAVHAAYNLVVVALQ